MCGRTSEISASHGATVSLLMVIYLIRYPLTSNNTEEIRFAYTIPVDRAYRWVGLPMLTHVKLMINEALLCVVSLLFKYIKDRFLLSIQESSAF